MWRGWVLIGWFFVMGWFDGLISSAGPYKSKAECERTRHRVLVDTMRSKSILGPITGCWNGRQEGG